MLKPTLTIAICTYNRPELLEICLRHITPQLQEGVDILVVDNGTESSETICKKFPEITYVKEDNTGLSFARNTSIENAKGNWVVYLDDDAKAGERFVEVALDRAEKGYLVFGGVYYPWYHYGKPSWYKDEYASNKMTYTSDTLLPHNEYMSGGIMAIHKSVFEKVGSFNTELGMTGKKVGYGEESELQDRIRQAGIGIYYVPEFAMDHVVAEYKLEVGWFLKSNFSRGVDMAKYQSGNRFFHALKASIIALGLLGFSLISKSIKLVFDANYQKENWTIDVFKKWYKRRGFIQQLLYNKE